MALDYIYLFQDEGGVTDDQALSALTKLNWAAQRWPERAAPKIHAALSANPERILPMIMGVALQSGDPIGKIAAEWFSRHGAFDLALSLMNTLPHDTIVLRELASEITGILQQADDPAIRAMALNNLSVRLSDLGRREEALAAAEEAVSIYRDLSADRPDAFRPDLATSLNNVAKFLSALGRREEALAAAEESVSIRRELSADRPDAFLPDLAMSLNNVANRLSDLGRREEALAAAEQAVSIYRDLSADRPDAFRPGLAMSLSVLGDRHFELEDWQLASEAQSEALNIISEPLARFPAAHAGLAAQIAKDYLAACEKLDQEPDLELLLPIIGVLQAINEEGDEQAGQADP